MVADIDWAEEWKEEQKRRRSADNAEFWNNRAPSFAKTAGTSPYAEEFLQRAHIEPGDVIFDMGSGSGTLALPLARQGHEVYACDFSEVMLDLMMQRAELDGVAQHIHPLLLSWDEDWDAYDLPVCDLAFASRSIATADLQAALVKLGSKAKRGCCATLSTADSPRIDTTLLKVVGREVPKCPDCVFAFNILWGMGLYPEVSYIHSSRIKPFESFDAAIESTAEIMHLDPIERDRLVQYSKEHLHESKDEHGATIWTYDHARMTSWAFISWSPTANI